MKGERLKVSVCFTLRRFKTTPPEQLPDPVKFSTSGGKEYLLRLKKVNLKYHIIEMSRISLYLN